MHQLATTQQQAQTQRAAGGTEAEVAAGQYQLLIQVMMLQQHYVNLCKQHDVQLDALGSTLLDEGRPLRERSSEVDGRARDRGGLVEEDAR